VTNRFSEATGATGGFSNASRGVYTDSRGGFRKAICSSHVAFLEQLLALQQESLGKSVKILSHFARGEIKLVN
jgi:ascorbate-specific PTS system EIIC-type component UlaA